MKILLSSLALFFLITLSACSTVTLRKVEVKGMVYDNETEAPIKDATVTVKISEPWEVFETETGDDGKFSIMTSGNTVLSESFVEESDHKKSLRKVIVSLSHPEFVEDIYEEELDIAPVDEKQVDVGAFYLSAKEKEDFLEHIAKESKATAENTASENTSHNSSSIQSEESSEHE